MALKGWNIEKMPGKDPTAEGVLQPSTSYSNETVSNEHGWMSDGSIRGMQSKQGESLDTPGFEAGGQWIVKKGTPYGEAAMFNQLGPGMDIDNQLFCDIRPMALKHCTNGFGYPGDSPWPMRDIPE